MKVLYIQWAGNFPNSYKRYIQNISENYYGENYSVGGVVEQARMGNQIYIYVCQTKEIYNAELEKNLSCVGHQANTKWRDHLYRLVHEIIPDKVILRVPDWKVLRFLRKNNIPTFPVLADSFDSVIGIRNNINRLLLSRELRQSRIDWIANHQINAALSVAALGVPQRKILPYDWKHKHKPGKWRKNIDALTNTDTIKLFYVGQLCKEKGVYDLIQATKVLINRGLHVKTKIAGVIVKSDDEGRCEKLIAELNLTNSIDLLGKITNEEVLNHMLASHTVIVPSHHVYPEGLAMTIMESLVTQTPVITSDHPMFIGRLQTGKSFETFPEQNIELLANKIIDLTNNKKEYKNRCLDTTNAWNRLCIDLKWLDMINLWLTDNNDELRKFNLENLISTNNLVMKSE